jgi:hypothetical protein
MQLNTHLMSIHGLNNYGYFQFNFTQENPIFPQQHQQQSLQASQSMEEKVFDCPDCEFEAHEKSQLDRHMVAVHGTVFNCTECNFQAVDRVILSNHMMSNHVGKGPLNVSNTCPKCPYQSTNKQHVMSHYNAVHEKVREFSCMHCNFRASQKGNLKRHLRTIHNFVFEGDTGITML